MLGLYVLMNLMLLEVVYSDMIVCAVMKMRR